MFSLFLLTHVLLKEQKRSKCAVTVCCMASLNQRDASSEIHSSLRARGDVGQGFKGFLLYFHIAAHQQCQRCRVGLSHSLAGWDGWGNSSVAMCIQEASQMGGSGCLGTETYPSLELPSVGKPGWLSQSPGKGFFCVWEGLDLGQITAPQFLSCKVVRDVKRA